MLLTSTVALWLKLLFWSLAFAVFLREAARSLGRIDAADRRALEGALIGALGGSKLVHALGSPWEVTEPSAALADLLLHVAGGDSTIGGVLGARLGLWLAAPRGRGAVLADRLAPPTARALLVLALGAFFWALRGNSYGAATSLPWGVDFGDGVPRHPVMLYEAIVLTLFLLAGAPYRRVARAGGARPLLLLLCVSTLLFGFLKPPYDVVLLREAVAPAVPLYARLLTAEQWAAMIAIVLVLPAAIGLRRKDREATRRFEDGT
ncbi:MAG: prolipoprotein diacylglyceryl transferase [Burkholderiales bacterium]|nr:prolipoprotein diacylglyceryl transferase [Burkholderiales bacterium]